jgi:hypothetical protein
MYEETSGSGIYFHFQNMIKAEKEDGGLVIVGESGGIMFNPYRIIELLGSIRVRGNTRG